MACPSQCNVDMVGGPQTPCADLPLGKDSVENVACKFVGFFLFVCWVADLPCVSLLQGSLCL